MEYLANAAFSSMHPHVGSDRIPLASSIYTYARSSAIGQNLALRLDFKTNNPKPNILNYLEPLL